MEVFTDYEKIQAELREAIIEEMKDGGIEDTTEWFKVTGIVAFAWERLYKKWGIKTGKRFTLKD